MYDGDSGDGEGNGEKKEDRAVLKLAQLARTGRGLCEHSSNNDVTTAGTDAPRTAHHQQRQLLFQQQGLCSHVNSMPKAERQDVNTASSNHEQVKSCRIYAAASASVASQWSGPWKTAQLLDKKLPEFSRRQLAQAKFQQLPLQQLKQQQQQLLSNCGDGTVAATRNTTGYQEAQPSKRPEALQQSAPETGAAPNVTPTAALTMVSIANTAAASSTVAANTDAATRDAAVTAAAFVPNGVPNAPGAAAAAVLRKPRPRRG